MTNKVLASFEDPHRTHCVDVFVRDDGTYGFEAFRSEADGDRRWQSLGLYSRLVFESGRGALEAAQQRVSWLDQAETWRW
ncbi:MAG: hypothetical protein ABIV63_02280 [Caldimonas sp.]